MKKKYLLSPLLFLSFFPNIALAYTNWSSDLTIFSFYDVFFDILGLSIALVSVTLGLQMINRISGGVKKAASLFFVTIFFYIVLQAMSLLSIFTSYDLTGLFSIIKFFWSIFFLITVIAGRSFIHKVLTKKSITK